jgi:hypothetical protein
MANHPRRILFAWENPNVPVDEVANDVLRAFHHPALRNENVEIQRDMFQTVRLWADQHPRRHELDRILSSESVKQGKNHTLPQGSKASGGGHSHGAFESLSQLGHGKVAGSLWSQVHTRDLDSISGNDGEQASNYVSSSPAPQTSKMPTPPSYSSTSGEAASYMNESASFQAAPAGYNAPPPPGQYYQSYGQQPPQGYPGAGPQGYGPPQGGQWQQPPPPPGYGGPGYGAPPPQGGYPPYGQGPPPSWNQYPGSGRY